ncbi:hypothetical protein CspHIS471_0609000 [Cutaneotrichosporon sp. HIS471]|nr:hypothetical protein CspHIS471_0609000 [Cutaneotrichosporon sp. HIS471]
MSDPEKIGTGVPEKDVYVGETNEYILQLENMPAEERAALEKSMLRKIDIRLLPWMTLLYLLSFLDRINIGAAKLNTIEKDLNLTGNMYNIASLVFFVSYVVFEIPSNLVLKKLRPSIYIPVTMVVWALFQIFMGLVTNFGQLVALRFCLGMAEAGLFPGLNFYLTGWYRRGELNKRVSFFFAGAVLAGAFGGALGYGFTKMDGIGGKAGWSWIFIMEGLLTLVAGVGSFWMIHDWPDRARFLTPIEREFVLLRLRQDTGLGTSGNFSWGVALSALKDWKTLCFSLAYVGAAQCIYSQSLFAPSIVAVLGKWSRAQSLLMSVPPYVLAFVTTMVTAYLSDKWMKRGVFNMFWSTLACVGYIILLTTTPNTNAKIGAQYFAVFLTTMSIAPLISTTISWSGGSFGSHYRKAVAMGMIFSTGNSGGIWASLVYRNQDAKKKPPYQPGHGTALAFAAMNGIMSAIIWFGLRRANRQREEKYGPAPDGAEKHDIDDPEYRKRWGLEDMSREDILDLGDRHPAFRFIL